MNWFYSLARDLWHKYQERQIQKGLEKYKVPLGDSNLSWQDAFDHAFEEIVDLVHYVTYLRYKLQQMQNEIDRLQAENKELKERLLQDW